MPLETSVEVMGGLISASEISGHERQTKIFSKFVEIVACAIGPVELTFNEKNLWKVE